MERRKRRILVMMQVYFSEFYPAEEYDRQCSNYLSQEDLTDEEKADVKQRAQEVKEKFSELDEEINSVAKWKTARMSKVDLAILRLALFEMRFDESIPDGVAINEAVELAKKYGSDDSPAYINGILGNLSRKNADGTDNIPGQPG